MGRRALTSPCQLTTLALNLLLNSLSTTTTPRQSLTSPDLLRPKVSIPQSPTLGRENSLQSSTETKRLLSSLPPTRSNAMLYSICAQLPLPSNSSTRTGTQSAKSLVLTPLSSTPKSLASSPLRPAGFLAPLRRKSRCSSTRRWPLVRSSKEASEYDA